MDMLTEPKIRNISIALRLYPYTLNKFFWSDFLLNETLSKDIFKFFMNSFVSGAYRFQRKNLKKWRLLHQERVMKIIWNNLKVDENFKYNFKIIWIMNQLCNHYLKEKNVDIFILNFFQSFMFAFYTKKRFLNVYMNDPNIESFKLISLNFGRNKYLKII